MPGTNSKHFLKQQIEHENYPSEFQLAKDEANLYSL